MQRCTSFPGGNRFLEGCLGWDALVRVSLLGRPPAEVEDRRHAFALLFRGPGEPILAQRTFQVDNERLGSLHLFLVPIGPDRVGMQYEAAFTWQHSRVGNVC